MKSLRSWVALSLTLAGLLLVVNAAKADTLSFVIVSPNPTVADGQAVTFDGTATNVSAVSIYLNGDSPSLAQPLTGGPLSLDDSLFFNATPLLLNPGDNYTGGLFTVTVPTPIPDGTYSGSFVIQGGEIEGVSDDVLGYADFSVTVTEGSSPVPESTPLAYLLLAGFVGSVTLCGKAGKQTTR